MPAKAWLTNVSETKLLLLAQIINSVIAMIFAVLSARYCGPEVFGFFALSILVLSVLLDFVDFGAVSYYSREIAAKRIDLEHYVQIMNGKSIGLLSLSPFVLVILLSFRDFSLALLLLMFYPILWIRQNFLQQYLLAVGEIRSAVFLQVSNRILWLISIPLIWLQISAGLVYALPIVLGLLLENVAGIWLLKKCGVSNKILFSTRTSEFRITKNFGFLSLMSDIAMLDVLVVERVTDLVSSASYTVTQRLRGPLLMIFQALNSRLRPLVAVGDRKQIISLLRGETKLVVFGILGIFLSAILSSQFADDLLGNAYLDINIVMSIGILVAIPSGLVTVGAGFIASSGRDRAMSRVNAVWVPTMLITVGIMANRSGGVGAIIGLFVSYAVLAAFVLAISVKVWKSEFSQ